MDPATVRIEEAKAKVDCFLDVFRLVQDRRPRLAMKLLGSAHSAAQKYARLSGKEGE